MNKRSNLKKFIIMVLAIFVTLTFSNIENLSFVSAEKAEEYTIEALTHENVVENTGRFMDMIVQDIDESYRVVNFDTKQELLEAFTEVAHKEVAQPYVDFYFTEREEGLYILPTETPPWFIPENDYDMIELDKTNYIIKQTNDSYIYGEYTIEFKFTYETDWKITEIAVK